MLIQLVSWPMRHSRVCGVTLPKPSTGQPRKSEPQDQRLPSDARTSPCLSAKLMAGVPLPTGNLSLLVISHVTSPVSASSAKTSTIFTCFLITPVSKTWAALQVNPPSESHPSQFLFLQVPT